MLCCHVDFRLLESCPITVPIGSSQPATCIVAGRGEIEYGAVFDIKDRIKGERKGERKGGRLGKESHAMRLFQIKRKSQIKMMKKEKP